MAIILHYFTISW